MPWWYKQKWRTFAFSKQAQHNLISAWRASAVWPAHHTESGFGTMTLETVDVMLQSQHSPQLAGCAQLHQQTRLTLQYSSVYTGFKADGKKVGSWSSPIFTPQGSETASAWQGTKRDDPRLGSNRIWNPHSSFALFFCFLQSAQYCV